MTPYIEVHWTSGSLDEARRVCRYLVQERLVACAQIIPWIESTFLWNDKVDAAQESKIVLKTRRERFDEIKAIILENCSYEVPEITFCPIEGGHSEYLDWIGNSTQVVAQR